MKKVPEWIRVPIIDWQKMKRYNFATALLHLCPSEWILEASFRPCILVHVLCILRCLSSTTTEHNWRINFHWVPPPNWPGDILVKAMCTSDQRGLRQEHDREAKSTQLEKWGNVWCWPTHWERIFIPLLYYNQRFVHRKLGSTVLLVG